MMLIEKIAHNLSTQRNEALDTVALVTAQRDDVNAKLNAAFAALEQCILSGQVPQEDAPALVASTPGFAEWRSLKTKQ